MEVYSESVYKCYAKCSLAALFIFVWSTQRKPVQVPLFPPQIPHMLTWVWTWATMVGSWRITSWAMAWPNVRIVNGESENMWEEDVIAYNGVLSYHLPRRNYYNVKHLGQSVSVAEIQIFQILLQIWSIAASLYSLPSPSLLLAACLQSLLSCISVALKDGRIISSSHVR